jgi:hypothetical protein
MSSGWYGVDLDGTLAFYDGNWNGPDHIGDPIAPMADLVKKWIAEGITVKILTARVNVPNPERTKEAIQKWCQKHLGKRLEVTCSKDYDMICLYDDRAVQVEKNTGRIIEDK